MEIILQTLKKRMKNEKHIFYALTTIYDVSSISAGQIKRLNRQHMAPSLPMHGLKVPIKRNQSKISLNLITAHLENKAPPKHEFSDDSLWHVEKPAFHSDCIHSAEFKNIAFSSVVLFYCGNYRLHFCSIMPGGGGEKKHYLYKTVKNAALTSLRKRGRLIGQLTKLSCQVDNAPAPRMSRWIMPIFEHSGSAG